MTVTYFICYRIAWLLLKILYPYKVYGKENLVEGAAMICANHSSNLDPLLTAMAVGRKRMVHFMAKVELSKVPILGAIIRGCGAFFVKRGEGDITAVRTAMKYLKDGELIMMFPEGTRTAHDGDSAAKHGAVQIASKMSVPIIPVHIPRQKKLFHRMEIHVGEAYTLGRIKRDELEASTEDLMSRIRALGDGS